MSDSDRFDAAISFSLEKLGLPNLTLEKEQRLAVKAVYDGNDTFVCLPTGYGKSLCYQSLPFIMDHKLSLMDDSRRSAVLVVSPLVALMINQVQSLRRRGVLSSIISSSKAVTSEYLATDASLYTDSLLFCAPEALFMSRWRDDPAVGE